MTQSDLFARIAAVLPTLEGWCDLEKATTLASAVLSLRPAIIVEIGVFGGKSLIPMALACAACGKGRVIGIDPWDAASSTEGYTEADADWWSGIDHEAIYRGFTAQVRALGIEPYVEVWRDKSDNVRPPDVIDLLHIDGQHTDQAVRDVQRFASRVRLGGLCCADDIAWVGGGVQRAVEELEKIGFLKLYELGTGAVFQRLR